MLWTYIGTAIGSGPSWKTCSEDEVAVDSRRSPCVTTKFSHNLVGRLAPKTRSPFPAPRRGCGTAAMGCALKDKIAFMAGVGWEHIRGTSGAQGASGAHRGHIRGTSGAHHVLYEGFVLPRALPQNVLYEGFVFPLRI